METGHFEGSIAQVDWVLEVWVVLDVREMYNWRLRTGFRALNVVDGFMVSFSLDLIHLQLSFIKMQTISRLIALLYGCTCRIPVNTQARCYLLFLCFWLPLAHTITIYIHDLYFSVIRQHNLMCEGGSVYHLLMWVQTPRFKENQCHMMKCSYGISRSKSCHTPKG